MTDIKKTITIKVINTGYKLSLCNLLIIAIKKMKNKDKTVSLF
jgi:hypothetical protein